MKRKAINCMNKNKMNILLFLSNNKFVSQRDLMERTGYSLGFVNKAINSLKNDKFLDDDFNISHKGQSLIDKNKPKRAIILAAGFGLRMVPINLDSPKALLEIKGEIMVERIIRQLHSVGISEIYIVVGFLKERFEYLIDEFGVSLIVNESYDSKNNLYSLDLISDKLDNAYIIPSDIWCKENPFRKNELYSWYMVSDKKSTYSKIRVNRKNELVSIKDEDKGNSMVGISYFTKDIADKLRENIDKLKKDNESYQMFWEEALFNFSNINIAGRLVKASDFVEIDTYEDLRELDRESNNLKSDVIDLICKVFEVHKSDIKNIRVLKKGMTNRSFLFSCKNKKYIMRVPGEGTDKLINRDEEAKVYKLLKGKNICDNIIYMDPENGYKITEFIENSRVCDPENMDDVSKCMEKLKEFHNLSLSIDHDFDIFGEINFYESLWKGKKSVYRDYQKVKKGIFSLKSFIEKNIGKKSLCHIDSVADNFLFTEDESVKLIDWEYAGMQDPHIDIAMFCIYSMYDKEKIDQIIDIYFDNECDFNTRLKIYAYISSCGLLWSNWCEYKRNLGVDFGEYSIKQYRYAKEYYRIVRKYLKKEEKMDV